MGEPIRSTASEVGRLLRARAHLSVALGVTLGACGLATAVAARHRDDHDAFIIGTELCVCAFTMIIGWGASSNHGLVARLISDGFDTVTQIERETGSAVIVALDDLRNRRDRRVGSH